MTRWLLIALIVGVVGCRPAVNISCAGAADGEVRVEYYPLGIRTPFGKQMLERAQRFMMPGTPAGYYVCRGGAIRYEYPSLYDYEVLCDDGEMSFWNYTTGDRLETLDGYRNEEGDWLTCERGTFSL